MTDEDRGKVPYCPVCGSSDPAKGCPECGVPCGHDFHGKHNVVPAEEVERLREALERLIDWAHAADGALEQEFGVSTDPGYGEPDPAIVKAEAALSPQEGNE